MNMQRYDKQQIDPGKFLKRDDLTGQTQAQPDNILQQFVIRKLSEIRAIDHRTAAGACTDQAAHYRPSHSRLR
jgi:hypothetical protein